MTVQRRQTVEALRQWATLVLAVVNLTGLVIGGAWWGRGMVARDDELDAELGNLEKVVVRHHSDGTNHMPLEQKIDLFVLRKEFEKAHVVRDRQMEELRGRLFDDINRLDAKVDKVLNAVQ